MYSYSGSKYFFSFCLSFPWTRAATRRRCKSPFSCFFAFISPFSMFRISLFVRCWSQTFHRAPSLVRLSVGRHFMGGKWVGWVQWEKGRVRVQLDRRYRHRDSHLTHFICSTLKLFWSILTSLTFSFLTQNLYSSFNVTSGQVYSWSKFLITANRNLFFKLCFTLTHRLTK